MLMGQNTMTSAPQGSIVKGRLMYSEKNYSEVITAGFVFALSSDKKQVLGYTTLANGTLTTGGGAWEISGLPKTGKIIFVGYASKVHRLCWMQELSLVGGKYYNLGDNLASIPTPTGSPTDALRGVNADPAVLILQSLLTIGWVIDFTQKGDKLQQIDALTDELTRYLSSCTNGHPLKIEGVFYSTVQIGTQCWMGDNLNDGKFINSDQSQTNNSELEKYCYNNDEKNCEKYGGLYQWDEMMKYTSNSGSQGICPDGWHIPTFEEFTELMNYFKDNINALKSTEDWNNDKNGNNQSNFNALPSGNFLAGFKDLGDEFGFWTSKELTEFQYKGQYAYIFYSMSKNLGYTYQCRLVKL